MKTDIYSTEEKKFLLNLARESIEHSLVNSSPFILPDNLDPKFSEERATFVTLTTSDGMLRGCIGNVEPFETLIESVPHNARNAALHDPRFEPIVSSDELESLDIELSILTPIVDIESYKDYDVNKHGIILRFNNRGALFLPQVAKEQGWGRESTLSHLSLKAGLPANAWKDKNCKFKIFEVQHFSEKDF